MSAVDNDLIKAGTYSSGHCPGFPPGSLLSPDLRQETRNAITQQIYSLIRDKFNL
jgi:hypothetical protein